jgi:hypothetical protein
MLVANSKTTPRTGFRVPAVSLAGAIFAALCSLPAWLGRSVADGFDPHVPVLLNSS